MESWDEFAKSLYCSDKGGLMLDWSGMGLDDGYLASMEGKAASAMDAMRALEAGGIANRDEGRMVGHYWLRAPELAPDKVIAGEIESCQADLRGFSRAVHSGAVRTEKGGTFKNVVVAGIGGSSLGPVFVADALAGGGKMKPFFMDNTDPAGMDAVFSAIEPELDATMAVIISKSGGTIETRNCMTELRAFFESHGLSFAKHAVCVTGRGSRLDAAAEKEDWIARFPMWDWVGGRTSVMSAVGLLPLSLIGIDTDEFLRGAAECDVLTRENSVRRNPAMMMALSWYKCSGGAGGETMVVLPYKDSLRLFAKYLQQLFMESLGKELSRSGATVNQGLALMGNKGSTDQHSYVQQLVGGPKNIFVTFVQVLRDRAGASAVVGEGSTSGDYLNAFMLGTKKALESHGQRTMTVTIPEVDAYHVGQLIALFERAVGFYAEFIDINAYNQPAVELGKRAADDLIKVKNAARDLLVSRSGQYLTARQIAEAVGAAPEDVLRLLLHLSANDAAIDMRCADRLCDSTFAAK